MSSIFRRAYSVKILLWHTYSLNMNFQWGNRSITRHIYNQAKSNSSNLLFILLELCSRCHFIVSLHALHVQISVKNQTILTS